MSCSWGNSSDGSGNDVTLVPQGPSLAAQHVIEVCQKVFREQLSTFANSVKRTCAAVCPLYGDVPMGAPGPPGKKGPPGPPVSWFWVDSGATRAWDLFSEPRVSLLFPPVWVKFRHKPWASTGLWGRRVWPKRSEWKNYYFHFSMWTNAESSVDARARLNDFWRAARLFLGFESLFHIVTQSSAYSHWRGKIKLQLYQNIPLYYMIVILMCSDAEFQTHQLLDFLTVISGRSRARRCWRWRGTTRFLRWRRRTWPARGNRCVNSKIMMLHLLNGEQRHHNLRFDGSVHPTGLVCFTLD